MAYSDPARLTPDRVSDALHLSAEAGWNQTKEDWSVFVTHGVAFGIQHEGALVGTAAMLPYGAGFGFVSMVLVTQAHRRHGVASRLLGTCLETLHARCLTPVLDATPAGQPVYEKLGFQAMFALERWEGKASGAAAPVPLPTAEDLASLDAAAFGADRNFLLRSFLSRPGARATVLADGFAVARPGFRATQLGPVVAHSAKQAVALLRTLLDSLTGLIFIDVPTRWTCVARFLETNGFRRQRPFTRMALDRTAPFGDPAHLFAAAGPEFG